MVIGNSKSLPNTMVLIIADVRQHYRGSNEVASALHNLWSTKLNIPPIVEIVNTSSAWVK